MTKVDDTLDVFGCHGVGGFLGPLCVGLFAEEEFGGVNGAFYGHPMQLWYEFAAVLLVAAYSVAGTVLILMILKYTIGIRVSDDAQHQGLDARIHHEVFEYGAIPFHHTARKDVEALREKRSHSFQVDAIQMANKLASLDNGSTNGGTGDGNFLKVPTHATKDSISNNNATSSVSNNVNTSNANIASINLAAVTEKDEPEDSALIHT